MKRLIIVWIAFAFIFASCQEKDYLITIKTKFGDIKVILYDDTPLHKKNFIKLASEGLYDSTAFHRIIQNFMIQGGDINARPGYRGTIDYTIPAEFVKSHFHHKGALAAARKSDNVNPDKASSGDQFYIVKGQQLDEGDLTIDMQKINKYLPNLAEVPGFEGILDTLSHIYYEEGNAAYNSKIARLKPIMEDRFGVSFDKKYPADRLKAYTTIGGTPHLDDAYTVFGRVVEGLDVVDKIASVQTGQGDKPVENVYITVEVENISAKKLLSKYPY